MRSLRLDQDESARGPTTQSLSFSRSGQHARRTAPPYRAPPTRPLRQVSGLVLPYRAMPPPSRGAVSVDTIEKVGDRRVQGRVVGLDDGLGSVVVDDDPVVLL